MARSKRNLTSNVTKITYKSTGEMKFHELYHNRYEYEPGVFPITISRVSKKKPDFVDYDTSTIIEYKGRIRDKQSLDALLCIKEQYPEYRYVMVLENPNIRAYPQARGKNTLGNWLTRNGIEWYHGVDGLPEDLRC